MKGFLLFIFLTHLAFAKSQVDSLSLAQKDSTEERVVQINEDRSTVDSIVQTSKEEMSKIPKIYPLFNMYDYWEDDHMNPYRFMTLPRNTKVSIKIVPEDCDFSLPIDAPTTSPFGYRWGRPHNGIDLDLETGDSVCAALDGVVRLSRWYYGFGNLIVIRHFNGLETCYAHLSKRALKSGDIVNAGQFIGNGGSTGRSTGSHLHFEIHFLGKPIDPERIIDFKNAALKISHLELKPSFFKSFYK